MEYSFVDFHFKLFSRKILNELSSPVAVSKIEEESNSSQSQDGDSPEGTSNLSGVQYQQGSCKWTNYSQLQYYSKFSVKHENLILAENCKKHTLQNFIFMTDINYYCVF